MSFLKMVLVAALISITSHSADLTVTYRISHHGSTETQISVIRSTPGFLQERIGDQVKLHDYAAGTIHLIAHAEKAIQTMRVETLLQSISANDEALQAMGATVLMGNPDRVKDLKIQRMKDRMVCGRVCKQVQISSRGIVAEVSFDPSLNPGAPLDQRVRFMQAETVLPASLLYPKMPQFAAMIRVWGEMGKLDGMILRSEIYLPPDRMMQQSSKATLEAIEVLEHPIPPETFSLPKGYSLASALPNP